MWLPTASLLRPLALQTVVPIQLEDRGAHACGDQMLRRSVVVAQMGHTTIAAAGESYIINGDLKKAQAPFPVVARIWSVQPRAARGHVPCPVRLERSTIRTR